jgi:ADP-ribose pyrophosphatase
MSDQKTLLNPWKILSTRAVYDNIWIAVTEYNVLQPKGSKGIYGVVHFKNKAIGILPIDADGNIYLVGQFRFPLNCYSWEIPEGGCSESEDPIQAAQRELLEETGITASNWQKIGFSHLSNSVTDELAILYLATGLTQGQASPEETEDLNCKAVPFAEALKMVLEGEITDAISVMAIMRYALTIKGEKHNF